MLTVLDCLFELCEFAAGSGVLVLTTTEVDKTGASYYGEQGLHYLSSKGDGNIVILGELLLEMPNFNIPGVVEGEGGVESVPLGSLSE